MVLPSPLLLLGLVICVGRTHGQLDYFDGAGVDASEENSVYLLMVIFFAINFITPITAWINRTYIGAILDKANERMSEIQQRISERISDAGRKLSDRVQN
jgi:hypothetical protein